MDTRFILGVVSIAIMGCVMNPKPSKPDHDSNAGSLTVDLTSNGRQILDSVPVESAMDRFEMIDPQGQIIAYIGFTDTDTGALIFVNQKLYGTLSHHDAQAFYLCRGHASTAPDHWAHEAADWGASLLANSTPATEVKLEFSGKSTMQSLKEVAESPFLKKLKSLFSLGTNPFGIFNSLNTTKDEMAARDQFDKAQKGLSLINLGMSESSVAEVMKPESVSFVGEGMVMAYPTHLFEYYVTDGVIKVIQQPSFSFLSKTNNALFYVPDIQWSLCSPLHWKDALPDLRLIARSGQAYAAPGR